MLKDSTTASTGVSDELEEVEEELGSGTGTAVPLSPSAKPAADPDDAESAPLSGGEKLPPAALDHNASEEDDSVHGGPWEVGVEQKYAFNEVRAPPPLRADRRANPRSAARVAPARSRWSVPVAHSPSRRVRASGANASRRGDHGVRDH